jgi:hypothetical protein
LYSDNQFNQRTKLTLDDLEQVKEAVMLSKRSLMRRKESDSTTINEMDEKYHNKLLYRLLSIKQLKY